MDILRGGFMPGLLGNGMGVATGGGSSYAAETEAIAAAFTTPPTTARKNLIDAAVVALKSAGVWDKLDALYAFAAADAQAAIVNWKTPGTYNCTEVNAPTFTADQGFTGAGTKYLDSGFNPSSAPSPKYVLNSACVFARSNTNVADSYAMLSNVGNGVYLNGRYTDNNAYFRINQNSANMTVASTDSIGFWSLTRSGASANEAFKNGASVVTSAHASSAVPATVLQFMFYSPASWPGQLSLGGFGQHLNSTEQTALYNALRTYLTGVGVP